MTIAPSPSQSASIRQISVIRVLCILLLWMLVFGTPALALNQRVYPLQELIKDAEGIGIGRAVAVDIPKMRAALVVDETLKGEIPYKWMALNVAPGGWGHPSAMIRRLGPGVPIVYFTARVKGRHVVLGYTNGTWFQITAPEGKEPDHLPWTFTLCEVFLRRTFSGSNPELEQLLRDVLAGKRQAPAPNPGAGSGMGPEVPANFQPPKPLPPLPEFIAKAIAAPKAGGVVRKIAVRPLIPEEQTWVTERAKQFQRTPEETAMLLAQANYVIRDAQRALEYERDHGRGGNRAWVRAAEEILDLKQRSDRLSWLDVRGTMMRAGELFTPVTDPVDLIHGLRTKFTWDELDPMFDDDKWGRKKLTEEIAKKLEARSPHPLAPSDKAKAVLYTLDFGKAGSGELPMEAQGWKLMPGANWDFARRQYDWDGGESGSQRPGALRIHSSGSQKNPLFNMPPKPGIPLAAKAGDYPGTALWFAAGAGDYEGRGRGGSGCYAHYDQSWVQVRQGDTRSFLIVAQVFTPDHTDEVGEPRGGWFYIRRPSRYISAGLRVVDAETRTVSLAPEQELLLKVEPALDRFDRVLLRVDITTQKQDGKRNTEGKNELKLAAYADGIGEVARATVDLNKARRGGAAALDTSDTGVAFAPAFGVRNSGDGFVPEFYLANLRVQQINDGPVEVIKGEPQPVPLAPKPAVASKAAAPVAPRTIQGPRSLVLAVDTSSSMAPMFDKARAALLETLGTLKPGERFALLDFCASVKPFAEDWTDVNPETLKRAAAWVQGLKVSSGTNTSGMLERALAYKGVNSIMIVTDGGAPNAGVTDAGQLLTFVRGKNASGARIDAVLVGQAPPDNLLARLAQENGGTTRTRQ